MPSPALPFPVVVAVVAVVVASTSIACPKSEQRQRALALLTWMRTAILEPDVVSSSAEIVRGRRAASSGAAQRDGEAKLLTND